MADVGEDFKRKRALSSRSAHARKKTKPSPGGRVKIDEVHITSESEPGIQGSESDVMVEKAHIGHGESTLGSTGATKERGADINLNPRSPGHLRFGSEDPVVEVKVHDASANDYTSRDSASNDSDDDAPEDVPVAIARSGVQNAATAAARAAEQRRQGSRRKRQERDALLKAQSSKSSRRKTRKYSAYASGSEDEIPPLLPDELLTDDSERAPTPPPSSGAPRRGPIVARKTKTTDLTSKDLKVGPVNVRVLDKVNTFLAPKAVARSKDRREAWLQGRPTGKGIKAFERKPMNAGFTRRGG